MLHKTQDNTFDYHRFFNTLDTREAKTLEDLYEEDRRLEEEAIRMYGHKKAYYETRYVSYPEFSYQHDAVMYQIHRQHTISQQDYKSMIKLKGRRYAKRMHHVAQQSNKESADHRKIRELLDPLTLSEWSFFLNIYYEFYHNKLLRFLQKQAEQGTYLRKSTIAHYLYFILLQIYEQKLKQQMTREQQQKLAKLLRVKHSIKYKQPLMIAGILTRKSIAEKQQQLQNTIINRTVQYIHNNSWLLDKQQIIKSISTVQKSLQLQFKTMSYASEALYVLVVMYNLQKVAKLPAMARDLLNDSVLAEKTVAKIYRLKEQFPELKNFLANLSYTKNPVFGNEFEHH